MPVADLMLAGGELMLLGMGIVFSFLVVLVFAMRGMSALATFLDRGQVATPRPAAAVSSAAPRSMGQEQLVAVITAAVARYRSARTH